MSNFASGYIKYINHLEQINDAATSNTAKMIREVEESYHEHIENISRNILAHHSGAKICMLSGPSSSGKTTTAHFLQAYLRNLNKKAYIVSMDNYYLPRDSTPLLPDGSKDFENVNALSIEKIDNCLMNIITDGVIEIPNYDFAAGNAVGVPTNITIGDSDIVIMEGIHALNPKFTESIPENKIIKLYVSVKQEIKDVNGSVMSPTDIRLVRRIVRDIQFRGTSPESTLSMWKNVIDGENKYIRPYRMTADYTVNSVHIYEPCVLRTIAIPLLRKIAEDSPHYRKARTIESRLMRFEPISSSLVPLKSLLREFIGQ